MRVAHVIAPALVGGAETVVRLLAAESAGAGVEAEIIALIQMEGPHAFVGEARSEGTLVTEVRCGRRRYRAEAAAVAERLRAAEVAVVHTHGYHADIVGSWAARRCGLPVVATVHGFTGGGLKNRLYEWMQRRA